MKLNPISSIPVLSTLIAISGPLLILAIFLSQNTYASSEKTTDIEPEVAQLVAQLDRELDDGLEVVAQLGEMVAREQFARHRIIDLFKNPDLSSEVRKKFQIEGGKRIDKIDDRNVTLLKIILKKYSWRQLAEISKRAAADARLIVSHSGSKAFQKEALKEIEPFVEEKLMNGYAFAQLSDRIAVAEGRPQFYGTQSSCENGQQGTYNLKDPETVDQRRKKLGLEPLADYVKGLRETYGPC